MSYRSNQKFLKETRAIKGSAVSSNFKLNQKADVLEKKVKDIKAKKVKEITRLRKDILKAENKDIETVSKIKLGKYLTFKDFLKQVRTKAKLRPVVKYGDKYYTLTRKNINTILKSFKDKEDNDIFTNEVAVTKGKESDGDVTIAFTGSGIIDEIELSYVKKGTFKKGGAFFPYTHNTKLDLRRYQIYNGEEDRDYTDNCLIHAFKMWGELEDHELDKIKMKCINDHFPMSKIPELCKEANIGIIIKRLQNDGKIRYVKTNESAERVITINLYEDHYFLEEKFEMTTFAMKNYEEIKDVENFQKITAKSSKTYKRDKNKLTNTSFDVVKWLVNNKDEYLKDLEMSAEELGSSVFTHMSDEITTLLNEKYEDSDKIVFEEKKTDENQYVVFDYETTTDLDRHEPYLCSAIYPDNKIRSFVGEYCGKQFLESLDKDTTVIVHNLGYDFKFILRHLYSPSCIRQSTSRIPCGSGKFKNWATGKTINLKFKCSYTLTNMPLRDFAKVFDLECKKEVMPYGAYTRESVKQKSILIEDALKHLKEEDKEQFLKNIKEWKLKRGDRFNHIKYSQLYCEEDVRVTKEGYMKFREWIMQITGLDINYYATIATVADTYLKKAGCYEGCYYLKGITQKFIQKCIVGGRTMTRENKKWTLEELLADFDATSLYPSAMERMDGFLIGTPKLVENKSYDFLKEQSGYFIRINIKKVNKRYAFPLINQKNENGIRMFDNDLLGVHYVDKTGLEDLIKFQEIEFDVVDGYYFNEGRNPKIKETIRHLFEERVKMKKAKNPIQSTYKLLMNSSYGKSGQKAIDTEDKFIHDDDLNKYIVENYNYIKNYTKIRDSKYWLVNKINPISNHRNACHINCEILSMSKRIMNEVMCLAEDLGINIYYQDTDSMHIENDKINLLSDEFRKLYGKELIGENMGQFHVDFEFNTDKGTEIVAIKSIFLGKKCYLDQVRTVNDGKVNEDNWHVRMKGIPSMIVKNDAKDFENGLIGLYEKLYSGEKHTFDLLSCKTVFRSGANMEVYTVNEISKLDKKLREHKIDEFKRVLCF